MKHPVQPDKVTLARESRGLTQSELAPKLNISQGHLSKIELGAVHCTDEILARLAAVLDYPADLFCITDQIYGAGPNDLYHRKRQSTSSRLMKKIYAHINLRRIQIVRMLQSTSLSCHVPRFPVEDSDGGEMAAAELVRAQWHLPRGPIANLTDLVERAGAIIVPCHFDTPLVDGISQWLPGHPPMFFMNMGIARSRYKMTLAHELAHVVMHAAPNEDMEYQANRFAGEFLMPSKDIRRDISILSGYRRADDILSKLLELKLVWRVSLQALLTKASELGVISQSLVASAWKRLNQLGYRRAEPLEHQLPIEQPTNLRELVSRHFDNFGYTLDELARSVHLSAREFRQTYMPQEVGHLKAV